MAAIPATSSGPSQKTSTSVARIAWRRTGTVASGFVGSRRSIATCMPEGARDARLLAHGDLT